MASYGVFKQELLWQLGLISQTGLELHSHSLDMEENSSKKMLDGLRGLKLSYLSTESIDGTESELPMVHPLNGWIPTAYGVMSWNDVFRVVHDVIAHGQGHSFSPGGEHDAWLAHRAILPVEAQLALWCETKGQNSWINYGEHVAPGSSLKDRGFAPQKSGIVSSKFM